MSEILKQINRVQDEARGHLQDGQLAPEARPRRGGVGLLAAVRGRVGARGPARPRAREGEGRRVLEEAPQAPRAPRRPRPRRQQGEGGRRARALRVDMVDRRDAGVGSPLPTERSPRAPGPVEDTRARARRRGWRRGEPRPRYARPARGACDLRIGRARPMCGSAQPKASFCGNRSPRGVATRGHETVHSA